ncbi:hypothetical protein Tsubulata_026019 [Turnera subulata]|uniref:WAT1-related protein n=1 Tax=Turnera subulata TaxID=218843 RepID=A0A9Q0JFE9_9ROSI|nr:hypothetical protein Tsubulata_026019 [Turnera subulata]
MAAANFLPFLAMVIVQVGYAGMNTTSKLAMDSGMKPLVLVAYRLIFATFAMIPFAYFLEWVTGNQLLFFVGLEHSSLTISTALTNILPAVTFLFAIIFRQEAVGIKRLTGQAKVIGTILCVGGAMVLTFYHGPMIKIGESSIHWKYASNSGDKSPSNNSNSVMGSLIVIASTVSWSIWFIIQAKVSKVFPAPYTSTLLMCFMGSVECVLIGMSVNHNVSEWSLRSPFRLVAALYAGIVCTALAFGLTSWTIQRKGAVYASVFSPLLLVVTAILGWALLHEKIYAGTIVGSVLIVLGLYAVLWGKDRELKPNFEETEPVKPVMKKEEKQLDLELQLPVNSVSHK